MHSSTFKENESYCCCGTLYFLQSKKALARLIHHRFYIMARDCLHCSELWCVDIFVISVV